VDGQSAKHRSTIEGLGALHPCRCHLHRVAQCEHRWVTSTIDRPATDASRPSPRVEQRPIMAAIPVAAVSAAAWAAVCGLAAFIIVVTIGWVLSPRASDGIGVPLESGGLMWLLSHHTGVSVGPAMVTLLPLALLAVPLTLLRLAGRWAARITDVNGWLDQSLLVLAGTTAYALIAFGVSQMCDLGGAATVTPAMAVGWSAGVSAVGLSLGILSAKGGWASLWIQLPEFVQGAVLAAGSMAATLIAATSGVGAIALLANWSGVVGLGRSLGSGWTDIVGVTLVSLVYLPNLILWVLAYICGAGLVIGGGATASVFCVSGGLLPAFPALAAIPSAPGQLAPLLLVLVVLAGAIGAVVLRRHFTFQIRDEAGAIVVGASIVSTVVLLLTWLSGGGLGAGRLSYLGPKPVLTGLWVWGLITAGGLLVTLVAAALPRLRGQDAADDGTP